MLKKLMKNFIFTIICFVICVLVLCGCQKGSSSPNTKPLIITTVYPYELIVRELVDTLFTVETLIPPNASPHTWSPGPQELKKLHQADFVIANGLGLEVNLAKEIDKLGTKCIEASSYIDPKFLIHESGADENNAGNSHKETLFSANPHIWTSPDFLTDIVLGLSNDLSKRYPMLKDHFQNRARLMILEINQADGRIEAERALYKNPAVITLHDAFSYFFRYFHIDFIGAVQPSPGREPSPRQLKELADKAAAKGVKTIFIEPRINPKPAETLAKELNLKVLTYDDLGTTLKVNTIADYLWQNWLLLKAGL